MKGKDLIETFGISVIQLSTDLNRYLHLAPDDMQYDQSAKAHVGKSGFNAQFLKPDATRYFFQLRPMRQGFTDVLFRWMRDLPDISRSRQTVVAFDYGMSEERAMIKWRKALLYNALRKQGLDIGSSAREPKDQKIILSNKAKGLQ